MDRDLSCEEVKDVVFSLNKDSTSGPYGFSGEFFQSCWDIVEKDTFVVVLDFFCGMDLPRYVTQTTLALILKKEKVERMTDLKPISLSTFINKVISKVIYARMVI